VSVLLSVVGEVTGVTQLHDVVYVVCWRPSTIRRYSTKTHEQLTDINVKGLTAPLDMTACQLTSQLYVSDRGEWDVEEPCVWRASSDGADIKRWWTPKPTDTFRPRTLSVTSSRLLMTSPYTSELMQLNVDGDELRRVKLPQYMYEPRHAVESPPTGTFIVSHVNTPLKQHGQVSEVNSEGRVLRQFSPGLSLGRPLHIAVDSQGNIFVAEWRGRDYSRILLLDAQLALRRVIIDQHQLNYKRPHRLCYNEQTVQLMVVLVTRNRVTVAVFDVLRR